MHATTTSHLQGGFYDDNKGMDYHVPVVGGTGTVPTLRVVHVAAEMAPIAKVRRRSFACWSARGGLRWAVGSLFGAAVHGMRGSHVADRLRSSSPQSAGACGAVAQPSGVNSTFTAPQLHSHCSSPFFCPLHYPIHRRAAWATW